MILLLLKLYLDQEELYFMLYKQPPPAIQSSMMLVFKSMTLFTHNMFSFCSTTIF